MPIGAISYAATVHNGNVYIRARHGDESSGKWVCPVLVYSTSKHKWNAFPEQQGGATVAVVRNCFTLIGGWDVSTGKVTDKLSTWHEEDGRKQVLPPMPTRRTSPAAICHANLLLVAVGVAAGYSTVLSTTDVLDLTTMTWSTPKGLNLPVPLWGHYLALCEEYLYVVGLQGILYSHQTITTPRHGEQSGAMSSRLQPHQNSWPSHSASNCRFLWRNNLRTQLVDGQKITSPLVRYTCTSLPETSGSL